MFLLIFQYSHADISEEQLEVLEGLIIETIEELRKTKKTSNEIAIAKKIIVRDKRFTCEMIWAQMAKCIEDGLIEKVILNNEEVKFVWQTAYPL